MLIAMVMSDTTRQVFEADAPVAREIKVEAFILLAVILAIVVLTVVLASRFGRRRHANPGRRP